MKLAAALFSAVLIASVAASAQMPDPMQENRNFSQLGQINPGAKKDGTRFWHYNPKVQPAPVTAAMATPPVPGCPVSMQAKQGNDGGLVAVRHPAGEPQPEVSTRPSQHIHLLLSRFAKENRVTGATVTARGLSAHGRVDRTSLFVGEAPSDIRRTLDVTFTAEEDGTVSADLTLAAFTAVNSIRLESLTYADGSTWKVADGQSCTVQPDLVMRIAAR